MRPIAFIDILFPKLLHIIDCIVLPIVVASCQTILFSSTSRCLDLDEANAFVNWSIATYP